MNACCTTESRSWRVATTNGKAVAWQTPPALYLPLEKEFDFTIDVAADDGNAKCDRHFDREIDALAQSWAGERVFCNPPYGRELERWVKKAYEAAADDAALVVMVLPARTGNAWFHRYVLNHAEVRFIRGRLGFTLGGARKKDAPFDSMVVIFRPGAASGRLTAQPCFPFEERSHR
jgi:phage N-6-adenine-methyltransferase